jgi:hypothetical protein
VAGFPQLSSSPELCSSAELCSSGLCLQLPTPPPTHQNPNPPLRMSDVGSRSASRLSIPSSQLPHATRKTTTTITGPRPHQPTWARPAPPRVVAARLPSRASFLPALCAVRPELLHVAAAHCCLRGAPSVPVPRSLPSDEGGHSVLPRGSPPNGPRPPSPSTREKHPCGICLLEKRCEGGVFQIPNPT